MDRHSVAFFFFFFTGTHYTQSEAIKLAVLCFDVARRVQAISAPTEMRYKAPADLRCDEKAVPSSCHSHILPPSFAARDENLSTV